jgi:hypothetical protein
MLSETSNKFLVCEFRDSILALGNAFSCPCYGNLESSVGSYMYIVAIGTGVKSDIVHCILLFTVLHSALFLSSSQFTAELLPVLMRWKASELLLGSSGGDPDPGG